MCEAETANEDGGPDVQHAGGTKQAFVSEKVRKGFAPDLRTVGGRDKHDGRGEDETFGWAVKDSEVEGVGVVGLPSAEEHGKSGYEGGQSAERSRAKSHGGGFEEGCKSAVEGVNAVAVLWLGW